MVQIVSFEEALKRTEGQKRSLLLGNGFSATHFSYANLLEQSGIAADDPIRGVFGALDTFDFERVMNALEASAVVSAAYSDAKAEEIYIADAERLREGLIHAIRETHPGHRDDIEGAIPSCCRFLKSFDTIFTLNYDLLLYWVQLAMTNRFRDGFGLGKEENGFRGPFLEHAYCEIYNLHGGLHLFQDERGDIEKRVHQGSGVIDAISETVLKEGRLPVYVAEGTSMAKVRRINSVSYLAHCYSKLQNSTGNIFVYGHSADENDSHIYSALFRTAKAASTFGKVAHLYFCVYQPSGTLDEVHGRLAKYKASVGSDLEFTFVDAESAQVWDGPAD